MNLRSRCCIIQLFSPRIAPLQLLSVWRVTGLTKDGREFPIEFAIEPWLQENELNYTAIIHDISKRKRAESDLKNSEEKLRVITENANDAIVMIDPNGYVSFWNPAF